MLTAHDIHGQPALISESVPGDTVLTNLIPSAAYTSDLGFFGGVIIRRIRYHPDATPYASLTEGMILASTKGLFDLRIMNEQTGFIGRSIRSRWTAFLERHPIDNYFGIGNHTPFETDKWDEHLYYYKVIRSGLEWRIRKTVFQSENSGGKLDFTGLAGVHYEMPDDDEERLMGQERPEGIDGGWVNSLGTGLIWENRDSEFVATRGNYFELTGKWAPSFLMSDYPMISVTSDIRQFFTIPIPYFRPVLALRMAGSWATGSIPYWERPYLGGQRSLRGYPEYRYRGNASLLYNIELRSWIYQHREPFFKLGVHGFHDSGRVFDTDDSSDDLFRDYHRTYGGGAAIALFTPDFILRLDLGSSDEMYRLYMNVGYMF